MTEADAGLSKRSCKSDATSWKITKKKSRDDEKQEKRRVKEEERIRLKAEKKNKKKSGSKTPGIDDFAQSEYNLVPLFVEKCITFIQEEGLDLEGIYRVPGNRAHVDLLFQKFDEGKHNVFITSSSSRMTALLFWIPCVSYLLFSSTTCLCCRLSDLM
jgi:hypothetical protein